MTLSEFEYSASDEELGYTDRDGGECAVGAGCRRREEERCTWRLGVRLCERLLRAFGGAEEGDGAEGGVWGVLGLLRASGMRLGEIEGEMVRWRRCARWVL